jgi:uncharacterized membrane protein YidH (DUF202 family)
MEGRNVQALKRLVGDRFEIADTLAENVQKMRNKWTATIIFAGLGIAALGTAAYLRIKNKHKIQEPVVPTVTSTTDTTPSVFKSFNKIA